MILDTFLGKCLISQPQLQIVKPYPKPFLELLGFNITLKLDTSQGICLSLGELFDI